MSNNRTRPTATVPQRKQDRRRMEARRVIEGELSNIGVHSLSNDVVKVPIRASSAARCLLKWIFPLIYAIFYATERASPLSSYTIKATPR